MTIIGKNVLTGSAAAVNTDVQVQLTKGTLAPTLPASQELISMHWGYGDVSSSGTSTINAALYDITSGVSGAPKIAGTEVAFVLDNTSLSGNQWVSITGLSVDLSAHSGKTLAILSASPDANGAGVMIGTSSGSTRSRASGSATALPATYTEASTSTSVFSLYGETQTISSRSITDIDGDDSVQAGQTGVVITTVSMDASPATQTVTLGGETLTVNSWSATSINVDIPLHINLEWGSIANTLSLTDDTGTVTLLDVTLTAPTGWETVTFNGTVPDSGTTESLHEEAVTDLSFTGVAGDIYAWETQTGLSHDVQTLPTVLPPATVTFDYKVWDASLSTWSAVGSGTWSEVSNGIVIFRRRIEDRRR